MNKMECNQCGAIELAYKGSQRQLIKVASYECESCHAIVTFTENEDAPTSEIILGLKVAIAEAITVIDNDLHVSKAQNARAVLQDVLDRYGWPNEDVVAERRGAV